MKIIIPMTGKSKRFKKAGIKLPKQFLNVNNKMIIEHVLDMFPNEKDINFIVDEVDYKNNEYKNYFKKLSNYNIIEIQYQESGPGGALLESRLLETDKEVLINYCDFSNIWDWEDLKEYIKKNRPDGLIPSYIGLHPHSIYENNYAFLMNEGDKVLDIKEKEPFTENKINEYASTGTYYFKSGVIAKDYIKEAFKTGKYVNNEIYISTPYEDMIKDKLDIRVYEIKYFFQWGTPEDYNEFLYNLKDVENIKEERKIDLRNINLLIPAAGESSRFKNKNYKESKIYLNIDKDPLIVEIINSFNNQIDTKILILEEDFNSKLLNQKELQIEKITNKTKGQAESALKLVELIDNNDPILIHSADCILEKSTEVKIDKYDIVVYTKKNYRRAFAQDLNYGWINSADGSITSMSIKKAPESKDSNVIIGSFLFKNSELYKELYEETSNERRDTKEIHIDHLVETAINNGLKVKDYYTENSVMLGTPIEYELFNYMKYVYEYLDRK